MGGLCCSVISLSAGYTMREVVMFRVMAALLMRCFVSFHSSFIFRVSNSLRLNVYRLVWDESLCQKLKSLLKIFSLYKVNQHFLLATIQFYKIISLFKNMK